jgi:hypothetical protein
MKLLKLSDTSLITTLLSIFSLYLVACGATATPPLAVTGEVTLLFIYTNP